MEIVEGEWAWGAGRVGFFRLWIPREFTPEFFQTDVDGKLKADKPEYWLMPLESHFGTKMFEIFSDADVPITLIRVQSFGK